MGAIARSWSRHFVGGGVARRGARLDRRRARGLPLRRDPRRARAYRGAHEVITTIMLNFVAIQVGRYLVGIGGPLQKPNSGTPFSEKLPDVAAVAAVLGRVRDEPGAPRRSSSRSSRSFVYWLILERTTLGYEVSAVGYNPEAARYGGVYVQRAVVLAMGIAGAFAGLAGSGETLGHYYQLQENTLSGVLVTSASPASPSRCSAATPDRDHPRRAAVRRPRLRRAPAVRRDPGRARARARDDHPGRRDPVRRRRGDPALAVPLAAEEGTFAPHQPDGAGRGADARGADVNGPSGAVTAPSDARRSPEAPRPGRHGRRRPAVLRACRRS